MCTPEPRGKGGGGGGRTPDFKWRGWSNQLPKNIPRSFQHNPNKYAGPKINPQKSHAEFPSLKKFPEMLKWYNTKNKNGVDIVCLGLFIHHTIWKKSEF